MPIRRPYLLTIIMAAFGCTSCGAFQEPPPCDPASYAQLAATCGDSEEECERVIDERKALCAKRIEADK